MTTWIADIDWTADTTDPDDTAQTLVELLADHDVGAVTYPTDPLHRWGATLTVQARTIRQATDAALAAVVDAARAAGQRRVQVLSVHVDDPAGYDHQLRALDLPDLVGFATAAEIGGVSRVRARQLFAERPDHPRPLVVTEYGPLFARPELVRFYAEPRRPGRRPRSTA